MVSTQNMAPSSSKWAHLGVGRVGDRNAVLDAENFVRPERRHLGQEQPPPGARRPPADALLGLVAEDERPGRVFEKEKLGAR